jgi:hypothetical protein
MRTSDPAHEPIISIATLPGLVDLNPMPHHPRLRYRSTRGSLFVHPARVVLNRPQSWERYEAQPPIEIRKDVLRFLSIRCTIAVIAWLERRTGLQRLVD